MRIAVYPKCEKFLTSICEWAKGCLKVIQLQLQSCAKMRTAFAMYFIQALILSAIGDVGFVSCTSDVDDAFNEELMLKPLPSGHVYAHFQFTTLWRTDIETETFQHSRLFPRGLGEIIGRHNVRELHVSLTEGLWRYEKWGYPLQDTGSGAEVYAWFNDDRRIDENWKSLTNALAGLLCASLNFVDVSNSLSPDFTFRPSGAIPRPLNSSCLRYSSLPREIVCTENLTPFKKLLPCDSKKGLATLLNSAYIHNTNYHSIAVDVRPVCTNAACTQTTIELRQTISLVYDTMTTDSQDWSVRKLFGIGLRSACPLATLSRVYVDVTDNETSETYRLVPEPPETLISLRGGQENRIAVYDIKSLSNAGMFNVAAVHSKAKIYGVEIPPVLFANRYVVGYGQERGGLVTKLHNNYWKPLDVVLLENIPWYIPVYTHTIRITCQGKLLKPLIKRYVPGRERERPYYLEMVLRLPPRSVTEFSIELDYLFLKWQEYPPDANHGFYMGPAIITSLLPTARNYTALPQDGSTISSSFNASRDGYLVQLRTEILLVSLPTPDFSMPYNVICLACTAVALAFGPLHNITTKRLVLKPSKKNKLVSYIREKLSKTKVDKIE
ncbi:GPI transamidase component PIG-T [Neodiprion lecontei]|uniref:GPI transamidase component PIG-T n=1 Tax=Neodiprion lecontei TaxID=441921 RepID=A0A6J0BNM5_NEOLC|nr:GPI transamidase component PIG-T [Neodiprion lecontei]